MKRALFIIVIVAIVAMVTTAFAAEKCEVNISLIPTTGIPTDPGGAEYGLVDLETIGSLGWGAYFESAIDSAGIGWTIKDVPEGMYLVGGYSDPRCEKFFSKVYLKVAGQKKELRGAPIYQKIRDTSKKVSETRRLYSLYTWYGFGAFYHLGGDIKFLRAE